LFRIVSNESNVSKRPSSNPRPDHPSRRTMRKAHLAARESALRNRLRHSGDSDINGLTRRSVDIASGK